MTIAQPPQAPASPRRVLLLGASFATENRGVAALLGGALTALYQTNPEAQVALLDYARTPSCHLFEHRGRVRWIETITLRFSKNPFAPRHVARLLVTAALLRLLPAAWRARRIARHPVLSAIAAADFVGAISGGDSFSDLYGLRRLCYVAAPQWLVLLLGRPLVQLPQSYGPFRHRLSRAIARSILMRSAHLHVREHAGLGFLRAFLPAGGPPVSYRPDFGFALEPHPLRADLAREIAELRRQGPLVGVNVSGLLARDPAAAARFGLRAPYAELARQIVEQLVTQRSCSVVLIPHVFGFGGESDATAARELWQSLPRPIQDHVLLWPDALDQHEVKACIGRCDFFLGSRMHACIAAISQEVPTLALGYSDKFAAVFASVRFGDLVLDLRQLDAPAILARLHRALNDREELRERLARLMPATRERARSFFGPPAWWRARPPAAPVVTPAEAVA